MNNNEYYKVKYIDIQLIATLGCILALILSYLLAYHKKLTITTNKGLFDDKTAQNLEIFQSILLLIVAITFLYINYKQYKLAKEMKTSETDELLLRTDTAVLAVISSIVSLYIIYKNYKNNNLSISEIETF